MFYTQLARVIAAVGLLYGLVNVGFGFALATGWISDAAAFMQRYFPTRTTGEMIDHGVYAMVIALALGTVAEVGLGVHRLVRAGAPPR